MKQKNFLLTGSFALAVAFAVGSYHAYASKSAAEDGNLLMANVEALAGGFEVSTSWRCDASKDRPCETRCNACGSYINGSGALFGEHSCKPV